MVLTSSVENETRYFNTKRNTDETISLIPGAEPMQPVNYDKHKPIYGNTVFHGLLR